MDKILVNVTIRQENDNVKRDNNVYNINKLLNVQANVSKQRPCSNK